MTMTTLALMMNSAGVRHSSGLDSLVQASQDCRAQCSCGVLTPFCSLASIVQHNRVLPVVFSAQALYVSRSPVYWLAGLWFPQVTNTLLLCSVLSKP